MNNLVNTVLELPPPPPMTANTARIARPPTKQNDRRGGPVWPPAMINDGATHYTTLSFTWG